MLDEFILVIAVTIDMFIMSISCGIDRIKIPIKSAVVISIVGTIIMAIALYCSNIVSMYIPRKVGLGICCTVLCAMGIMNIAKWIVEKRHAYREIKSTLQKGVSMWDVFVCGSYADCDHSKDISISEALSVSILMSLDTLICGVATGSDLNVAVVLVSTFVLQTLAVLVGSSIGRNFSKIPDISIFGGILLIILGISKII
jgi:putative sporulation protein YtaF